MPYTTDPGVQNGVLEDALGMSLNRVVPDLLIAVGSVACSKLLKLPARDIDPWVWAVVCCLSLTIYTLYPPGGFAPALMASLYTFFWTFGSIPTNDFRTFTQNDFDELISQSGWSACAQTAGALMSHVLNRYCGQSIFFIVPLLCLIFFIVALQMIKDKLAKPLVADVPPIVDASPATAVRRD